MTIEIINTGSELLAGRRLNLHQQWLCRHLTDLGYRVVRQVAVADTGPEITAAIRESLGRAEVVITTGGLGPTADDLTRDLLAKLLDRPLVEDTEALRNIERFFAGRNRPMPPRTRVQALVVEGALVLQNAHGTAPGLAVHIEPNPFHAEGRPAWLILLPGPPRELHPMFRDQVAPLLREKCPPGAGFAARTLKSTGMGESLVEEKIEGPLKPLVERGLELSLCAHPGEVEIRFAAHGAEATQMVADAEKAVRDAISRHIYGTEEDELETVVVKALAERKRTLALAESCTGGHIANRVTNVPGASAVLLAGMVTYSNAAKQSLLGVQAETLAAHGAVSEPTAREMAGGALARTGADFALAVTGIAGPSGGSTEKPVGTVFIALAGGGPTVVLRMHNPWDRETFKRVTTLQALEMLRRRLLGL